MNTRLLLLPTLCLGGAALLLAPARQSSAFTTIGGSLGETQRDVRVFDNFGDTQAHSNTIPSAQFPGFTEVELAVWKGIVEWGSLLHGDGTGDPNGGNLLGNGGANFDSFWAGNATAAGGTNQNIVSADAGCGGDGTLAFTETPISDGWRIIFCDTWVWDDGPGNIGARWDIQGVMAHEYGHALGLGHSGTGNATMFPSGSAGQTNIRSIEADDVAGVQFVYGAAAGTKPTIIATMADAGAGTITVFGTNFGATGNEVWFTNANVTANNVDPIARATGVSSTGGGTVISVAIPVDAGPGDVIVNISGSGGATLSNAFPTDLVGTFGTPPGPILTLVTPSTIEALIPGTAKTITLTGSNLDETTDVLVDGSPISPSLYTISSPTTILLDMPQISSLGAHDIGVTDGAVTDNVEVNIVAPSSPKLQWGTGDALNVVDRDDGLDMIVSGQVGDVFFVGGSSVGPPTLHRIVPVPGSPLVDAGFHTIPAQGWISVHLAPLPDPNVVGSTWHARSFLLKPNRMKSFGGGPGYYVSSNDQSITLVP